MALEIFSAFRKYPFRFILLVALGFFLTATSTQAGFEWVPAPKQTPEAIPAAPSNSALPAPIKAPAVPPSVVEQAPMPAPTAAQILSAPTDDGLSPMPGENAAQAAVVDAAPPVTPTQPLSAPPVSAQPVIKTRTFTNAAEMEAPIDESVLPMPSETAAPIADATPAPLSASPSDMAAAQAQMDAEIMAPAPIAATPAAAPVPQKQRRSFIVMPEDAPDSARAQLPESQIAAEKAEDIMIPIKEDAPVTARAAEPVSAMPVIVDDSETAALPMPIGDEETAVAPEAAPINEEIASVPAPMPAPAAGDYPTIEGFGSDMPLALALREVIPEDYAYSFGAGVDPGARVSWNGGKSWPDVVRDMLEPHGMRAELNGKVVVIRSNNMGAVMPMNDDAKSAIEPASGKAENKDSKDKEFSADVYSIRRQIINDPGEKAAQQPEETLDMIKELGVDNGAAAQKNAKGPQPLLPEEAMNETPPAIQADAARAMAQEQTDAQAMEASEKQALNAKSDSKSEEIEVAIMEEDVQPADIADEAPLIETAENEIVVQQIPVQSKNTTPGGVNALWEAQKGDSLKRTLDDWSKKSSYELVWESSHDYTIASDILVTGDFQRAVRTVFAQGMEPGSSPLLTFVAQTSEDQPGKIVIQDGTPG